MRCKPGTVSAATLPPDCRSRPESDSKESGAQREKVTDCGQHLKYESPTHNSTPTSSSPKGVYWYLSSFGYK